MNGSSFFRVSPEFEEAVEASEEDVSAEEVEAVATPLRDSEVKVTSKEDEEDEESEEETGVK